MRASSGCLQRRIKRVISGLGLGAEVIEGSELQLPQIENPFITTGDRDIVITDCNFGPWLPTKSHFPQPLRSLLARLPIEVLIGPGIELVRATVLQRFGDRFAFGRIPELIDIDREDPFGALVMRDAGEAVRPLDLLHELVRIGEDHYTVSLIEYLTSAICRAAISEIDAIDSLTEGMTNPCLDDVGFVLDDPDRGDHLCATT